MAAPVPRRLGIAAVVFVLGGAAALFGVLMLVATGGDPVCNGATMHPGDTCVIVRGAGRYPVSYDEMVEDAGRDHGVAPWILGSGVAVALVGGALLVRALPGRPASSPPAAPPR